MTKPKVTKPSGSHALRRKHPPLTKVQVSRIEHALTEMIRAVTKQASEDADLPRYIELAPTKIEALSKAWRLRIQSIIEHTFPKPAKPINPCSCNLTALGAIITRDRACPKHGG